MPARYRVLVTDPLQRAALSCVRALGRGGHDVFTIGASRGLAGASRFARRHIALSPGRDRDPACFVEDVRAAVSRYGIDVVVPITDAASRILLPAANHVGCRIAGPDAAAYERVSNKALLMATAPACGLRVPAQVVLEHPGAGIAGHAMEFEAGIVKPSRSAIHRAGKVIQVGVRYVGTAGELARAVDAYPPEAFPLLVQERCAGDGLGVFLLRDRGKTLLSAGHRRLREKPPSGGVSTYREAVAPPPDLLSRCERLLDALEYSGPAMVEFKGTLGSGTPALMEINARLWGSVQLAVAAGVNFPLGLVQWAMGDTPAPSALSAGTRCYWEWGEIDHALALWRKSAESLHLPPGTPTGFRAALQVLVSHRAGDQREVLDFRDPLPFLMESGQWISTLVSGKS